MTRQTVKTLITFQVTVEIGQHRFRTVLVDANSPSETRSIVRQQYGDDACVTAIMWDSSEAL